MNKIKNQSQLLDARIVALEKKQNENLKELQVQLNKTYQELRPSKLLYRAISDIKEEPKIKNNAFETLVSIVGGFLSKKILVGKSKSVFKNLLGFTIQYVTTKFISKKI
ncbi:hypothetical protein KO566_07065 [Flavobacteriaceae bacterium XHP0103]|uniref:hypothetical protein n=1 Tax=Marixanthotalea marina TaxID=2844359 RepID=UPI002989EF61|nr:hypothetical protein [Marixanthotalea marina]MBU3821816.1 hypothetical protein [Marixanthotalea marina]